MSMQIKARCHSDDHAVEVEFDARLWFEQASDREILALYECGWGGDYPADEVAQFFEGANSEIGEMFTYIGHTQRTLNPVGFECYVDEESAMAWLRKNHSLIAAEIEARQGYEGAGRQVHLQGTELEYSTRAPDDLEP